MVKVYHSANIEAVNWKIFTDNIKNNVSFFPTKSTATDVVNKICQYGLFDQPDEKTIYVVNIDDWKLTDETVKQCIKQLHNQPINVILALEAASVKNKIFTQSKIEIVKANNVTRKTKASLIHKLLTNAKIQLEPPTEEYFASLLPDKIDFIKNEITKLQLLGQKTFTQDEIKEIVFDLGDATVFNIIDSWLNHNEEQTIMRLNDLISKNVTIQAFVPIFALKLVQIKFFLTAKLAKWSSEIITAKQGLPFWQQAIYSNLKPYDKNLERINCMLDDLYQFDINVKKQRNIPYTQLIKILFK